MKKFHLPPTHTMSWDPELSDEANLDALGEYLTEHRQWVKNAQGRYDVQGDVQLNNKMLVNGKLPVKFGTVGGDFNCSICSDLVSLDGIPKKMDELNCRGCKYLKSLLGIEGSRMTAFWAPLNLESHVLGLFYTGCKSVNGDQDWIKIVNRYLPLGPKGAAQCSIALVKAGYKALAQL